MEIKKSLIALMMFGGLSSVAVAADNYIGLGYGSTDVDVSGWDNSDTLKIYGGQRFGFIGYEVGYHNFDRFNLSGSPIDERNEGSAWEASAVGYLKLSESFDFFGKAGLAAWELEGKDNFGTIFTDDGVDLTYGVGAQFRPTQNLSLRLEYQVFNDVGGADLSSAMFGVGFHF